MNASHALALVLVLAACKPAASGPVQAQQPRKEPEIEVSSETLAAKATSLLDALEEADNVPFLNDKQRDARKRVKDDVANWRTDLPGAVGTFVGDAYGTGGDSTSSRIKTVLGKPDKETTEELTPLKYAQFSFALADKDAAGGVIFHPLIDPKTGKALTGKVLWYGPVGFGFTTTAFGESLMVMMFPQGSGKAASATNGKPSTATPPLPAAKPPIPTSNPQAGKNWPSLNEELTGAQPIRVKNPNEFGVKVGLRSGTKGKDFDVPANGTRTVQVPNGRYDIYFQYSTDPNGLYQGDSFNISNNGVAIQIVKVVNGNYGIRKVK